jgi:hypothetical protein
MIVSVRSAIASQFCVKPTSKRVVFVNNPRDHETYMIQIDAFTYSIGPSSIVCSELGLAPPFHQRECLKYIGHGVSVSCVKWPLDIFIYPKLRNINPHNVTHSLISRNPRARMDVVPISLLIVTFLSLISRIFSLMQSAKEVNPHPRIVPCANMWSVFFFC